MKEITPIQCRRFLLESEDEVIHLVEFSRGYIGYFYDNAYQTEPWTTGMQILTKEEFEQKFNVEL
jgi:hypothetical protein